MPERLDICDDLHGVVHLDAHERAIVDSPWFQRLRRIRQLSLADMVFPGASHSRFAHSIGVFHLASRLADKFSAQLTKDEHRELRAAALLHDVGHFPFSHTLEQVYEQAQPTEPGEDPMPDLPGDKGPAASHVAFHERVSSCVIRKTDVPNGITRILRQHDIDPDRVASIVTADHPNFLLNQILKSDLDVDQLDYLLRDAKTTGSSYGQYDLSYLLECLEVTEVQDNLVLCVRVKGLHPLEHYVLAKYFYYVCVLHQKTRCMIEGMLRAIAEDLISLGLLDGWEDVESRLADPWFCQFDDNYVWERIRRARGNQATPGDTREAIEMLIRRDLPKVTRETHVMAGRDALSHLPPRLSDGVSEVVRRAITHAGHQKFEVLERTLGPDPNPQEMLQSKRPIRLLVGPTFNLLPTVPYVPTAGGEERIVSLESFDHTVVGRLAGQTTHILRDYHR